MVPLLALLGTGLKAFFGFKGQQAKTVESALNVLSEVSSSNAQREAAVATIISSEATSGYWLAAVWRPLTMMVFLGIIVSYWFGYVPPNFNDAMSPMMAEVFSLIKLGLGGYIGGRTIEKVISQIGLSGVLKKFVEKRLG